MVLRLEKGNSYIESDLFYIFLMIPIFEPDIFKCFTFTDNLYLGLKIIACICIIAQYFLSGRIRIFGIMMCIYYVGFLGVTVINAQSAFFVIKKMIETFLVCLLFEMCIYYKGKRGLYLIFQLIFILIIINAILLTFYPNGLIPTQEESTNYKMYFLSIKNGMINWFIVPAISGLLYNEISDDRKFRKKYIIFMVISGATIFYTGSSTGIIIYTLFTLYFILSQRMTVHFNLKKVLPILFIIYITIVVFRVQNNFSEVFFVLFGKDASFSGRDNLWDYAIKYFLMSTWYGNGVREFSLINFYGRSYTSHNFFLEVLMDGGVIMFSVVMMIIIILTVAINRCKNVKVRSHLTIAFMLFFVMSLSGSLIYSYQWFAILTLISLGSWYDEMTNNELLM